MPQLGTDNPVSLQSPSRILLYGREKTRKTMWALSAAQHGFNVLLLDGDDGAHISRQFPADAMKRVAHVRLVDKPNDHVFARTIVKFVKGEAFALDERTRRLHTRPDDKPGWFVCDGAAKLTGDDVVVIDSWTALTSSMKLQFSATNRIDLADAAKTDWTGYGWMQNLTDYILDSLHHLPCHIIVIAHEQQYEKYKGTGTDRVVDWSRTQPLAASGNTSGRLGKHFSDNFRFVGKRATSTTIQAKGNADQVGGSRYFPPADFNYEGPSSPSDAEKNWDFGVYASKAGLKPSGNPPTAYRFI